jgi:hypothetical protein
LKFTTSLGRGRRGLAVLLSGVCLSLAAVVTTATPVELGIWSQHAAAASIQEVLPSAVAATAVPAPDPTKDWFRPAGRNGGTEGLANALAEIALANNAPLYRSDGWGRTTGATTSDHSISQVTSWAQDLAVRGVNVPTPATETAAVRVAAALGEANWQGGDLTKVVSGYRFQILWKVAGHFDHVHVGVRKI